MRSRAVLVSCVLVCCALLYLASTAAWVSAQDRSVATTKGNEDRTVQVESATAEGNKSEAPIQLVPLPPGTVFERDVVFGEGAYMTAGVTEQLIYSNTLGTHAADLRAGNLVADDITTTVPGGCKLRRYEFPVVGKVDPAGIGGAYTVDFAMYTNCPGSVPNSFVTGLIIPGTQGRRNVLDQCMNALDNDGDGTVNDGCAAIGPAETGAQCLNATDDDGDGKINDGCPIVGTAAESDADAPRLISVVAPSNVSLPTNIWFGVIFSRDNAGVIVGTPPMTGFSCDKFDYPGFPCNAVLGTRGFPDDPQASFNLEIYADSACANSFTGYKNSKPSGSTFNPGRDVFLADDIQLSSSSCNMIAYEVAVRGIGSYSFEMRNNCESGLIAGTQRAVAIGTATEVRIQRYTFNPPIALPQNLWFAAKVNNDTGGMVIAGQQACIGVTADLLATAVENVCNPVPPERVGVGIHGAFNLAVTCAGPAPVGACCDMILTDENNEAVCRQVPKTNCPYPERFTTDRPVWVEGAECEPDPFQPRPCGVAACCTPDDDCHNLTLNECNAVPPLDSLRQWQRGRYCNSDQQRCPRIACLGRTGECTLPRCTPDAGDCDTTRLCVGGLNPGTVCTGNANCRVCTNKKCSGSPANTVCTGTGQGTCPAGQTCNFITCTDATPCLGGTCPTGGVCGTAPNICTAGLVVGIPCTNNSQCNSGVCNLTTHICACRFDSDCHCPDNGCQVNPTCCDSCPPVGCVEPECCTDVCNIDVYCCNVEWDQSCADRARVGMTGNPPRPICDIRPANDVCAPERRLRGAREMTTYPPNNTAETDSGRATEDPSDPGFGCYAGNPGATGLQTVWYKFYATHTTAQLQTCLSNSPATDSLLGVFAVGDPRDENTQCSSLIPVGCSDDVAGCSSSGKNSKVCVRTIPGEIYYVMVAAKEALQPGKAYRLDISAPCTTPSHPLGDFCPDALPILKKCSGLPADTICTGTGQGTCPVGQTCDPVGTTAFNLGDATMTAPIESCIPTMTNDKWYEYTAICSGTLAVEACGTVTGTTTNLAIYEGGQDGECLCPTTSGGSPIGCRSSLEGPNCGPGSKLEVDVVEESCYGIRLADVDGNPPPSGNLKIACTQANCPAGQFTFTDPPDGVVDAARPHDPNNAVLLQGIQTIKATGPRDALASCFALCETTSGGPVNSIASVVQDPIIPGEYTIMLTKPITAGELTTITYTDTHSVKSTGRYTSHPGNVRADATTSAADVTDLLALLIGIGTPVWDDYSRDINRSGLFTPADLLEEIDLMTDDGPYDPPAGGWDGSVNQSDNPTCPPP